MYSVPCTRAPRKLQNVYLYLFHQPAKNRNLGEECPSAFSQIVGANLPLNFGEKRRLPEVEVEVRHGSQVEVEVKWKLEFK